MFLFKKIYLPLLVCNQFSLYAQESDSLRDSGEKSEKLIQRP